MSDLIYQELIAQGIEARERKDATQWQLGYLGYRVGEGRLKAYADAINVGYSSLRTYRQVYVFYQPMGYALRRASPALIDHIAELKDNPVLSYTHFRYAAMWEDLETALSFLDECVDNAWATDLAYAILRERMGKPGSGVTLVSEFSSPGAALDFLRRSEGQGEDYIVRVYKRNPQRVAQH